MNNNINFKANYIKPVTIYQYSKKTYNPVKANLVKCDLLNNEDLKTIEKISKKWGKTNYVRSIYKNLKNTSHDNSKSVYMLVLPQDSYKKVDYKNVLGCVQTVEKYNTLEIKYLQVNPEYTSDKRYKTDNIFFMFFEKLLLGRKNTKYKGIGTEIINFIKTNYDCNDFIEVIPDGIESGNFYRKNGFKLGRRYLNVLEWHKT